jgi:hypothetical protein
MKKLTSAAALLGAAIAVASPATALADNSSGKLTSYKKGKLTVFNTKLGKTVYRVNAKTNCGVSYGQSGDEIKCKTLGAAKYDGKPVRVTWDRADNGDRVATLVAVDLS